MESLEGLGYPTKEAALVTAPVGNRNKDLGIVIGIQALGRYWGSGPFGL